MTTPADNRICRTAGCDNPTVAQYRTCGPCRRFRYRLKVVAHYGSVCQCCAEAEIGFLTLDHINGGGKAHREAIFNSGRGDMWMWAWKNDFPSYLRLLCFNCNSGRARNGGVCPHLRPYRPPGEILVYDRMDDEQRAAIVARYAAGERGIDIAASLGLSKQTISAVVCRARAAGVQV